MQSAPFVAELTLTLSRGSTSQKVATSTVSASSTVINAPHVLVYVDVATYARTGAGAATAIATGADQYLVAGNQYRFPWIEGDVIAFITLTGTGNAYITAGA